MESEIVTSRISAKVKTLDYAIAEMGGLVEMQLAQAVESLVKRDASLAQAVVDKDAEVDKMEATIHGDALKLLESHQPLEENLRSVISALQTSSELERIGDYTRNIAKRTTALVRMPAMGAAASSIARMGGLVQGMIKDVLDAYQARDVSMADDIRRRDEEVDQLHTSLFRELLTYMMEDPRNITACTHLLFIAKNIERMGDHATNVAEHIYMIVHGSDPNEARPKSDMSSLTVIDNPDLK